MKPLCAFSLPLLLAVLSAVPGSAQEAREAQAPYAETQPSSAAQGPVDLEWVPPALTELRAQATGKDLESRETEAARDVYNAWVEARTTYRGIAVSQQLLQSAQEAFQLAQSRYQVGASSIVELSQADLQAIQAQITAATAQFDYQVRRRALDLQMGALK